MFQSLSFTTLSAYIIKVDGSNFFRAELDVDLPLMLCLIASIAIGIFVLHVMSWRGQFEARWKITLKWISSIILTCICIACAMALIYSLSMAAEVAEETISPDSMGFNVDAFWAEMDRFLRIDVDLEGNGAFQLMGAKSFIALMIFSLVTALSVMLLIFPMDYSMSDFPCLSLSPGVSATHVH